MTTSTPLPGLRAGLSTLALAVLAGCSFVPKYERPAAPVAATTVHHLAVSKDPMRMRNSPTNPLRPGTPIDESITTMNAAAKTGATA